MKDDFERVLTEYYKPEISPSPDTIRSLRIAIDKREKDMKWKQICITIAFILAFSIASFILINVFLEAIIVKLVLVINLILISVGSILFTTIGKKEILI